jgi:hypothetical protein
MQFLRIFSKAMNNVQIILTIFHKFPSIMLCRASLEKVLFYFRKRSMKAPNEISNTKKLAERTMKIKFCTFKVSAMPCRYFPAHFSDGEKQRERHQESVRRRHVMQIIIHIAR